VTEQKPVKVKGLLTGHLYKFGLANNATCNMSRMLWKCFAHTVLLQGSCRT